MQLITKQINTTTASGSKPKKEKKKLGSMKLCLVSRNANRRDGTGHSFHLLDWTRRDGVEILFQKFIKITEVDG